MNSTQHATACHYLLGKPAKEIFNTKRFSEPFVNQCLETLMRLHVFLLNKKEAFYLCDASAFNHQCQLNALIVTRIQREYSHKSQEERLERSVDNQFLHLSIFLSFFFLVDSRLYAECMDKAARESSEELPSSKKQFLLFAKDPEGGRTRAARDVFNDVFKDQVISMITIQKSLTDLHQELFLLFTTENLYVPRKNHREGKELYTPPKFAAVLFMAHLLESEKVPFALEIKVVTQEGTGSLSYLSHPSENGPGLVFDCMATDGSLSHEECGAIGRECPLYFFRNPSKTKRHSEGETCLFCNPKTVNLSPYEGRLWRGCQRSHEDV